MKNIHNQIINSLAAYFEQSGAKRVVVGISGGIDSALTLKLAVDALGADKVTAVSMPEAGVSSQQNIMHAKKLSEAIGVTFFSVTLNQFLMCFSQTPWKGSKLANQNAKARTRAVILYHYANTANALVLGTSNRSETLLGYGTKYGDLAADIEVIGDLYKDEVFALADYLGLPREIIEKKPSAELFHGQTDEEDLGASYSELDPILKRVDMGMDALIERGMSPTLVHNVFGRIEKNRHKTQMPPIIKVDRIKSL